MTRGQGTSAVSSAQVRRLRQGVSTLADSNEELLGELGRANARAAEMQQEITRMRATLAEAAVPTTTETEAQCNLRGAGRNAMFGGGGGGREGGGTQKAPPPVDFKFQPRDRKVNWRQLQRLNIRRIMMNNDLTPICQLLDDVTFADLDGESVFNLTEGNLIKLFQLAQLMLEYVSYERSVLAWQYDDFLDNRERVLSLLERAGVTDVADLRDGTFRLGHAFQGLAGFELEQMFGQVRLEERTMARMALAGAVEETKRRVERDVEEGNVAAGRGGGGGTEDYSYSQDDSRA
mmetsp:Transcript_1564/g.4038  ORF Transcript_1564/g.4038 Transcript_1564/m.4038 type:complete len:291 (-) Transcript_1564:198-1070(-)